MFSAPQLPPYIPSRFRGNYEQIHSRIPVEVIDELGEEEAIKQKMHEIAESAKELKFIQQNTGFGIRIDTLLVLTENMLIAAIYRNTENLGITDKLLLETKGLMQEVTGFINSKEL